MNCLLKNVKFLDEVKFQMVFVKSLKLNIYLPISHLVYTHSKFQRLTWYIVKYILARETINKRRKIDMYNTVKKLLFTYISFSVLSPVQKHEENNLPSLQDEVNLVFFSNFS